MLKFLGIKSKGKKLGPKKGGRAKKRTLPKSVKESWTGSKKQRILASVSPPLQDQQPSKVCSLFTRGAVKSSEFKKRGKEVSAGQVIAFILLGNNEKFDVKWMKFEDDMLLKFSFHAVVHIREKKEKPTRVHLFTSLTSITREKYPWHSSGLTRLSPSVLKSAFQKCVRRSLADEACNIASALVEKSSDGLVTFMRRLFIVAVEDSFSHPQLPVLIWLTLAVGKGFSPSDQLLLIPFQLLYSIAKCPVKDMLSNETKGSLSLYTELKLSPSQMMFVRAFLIRAALGGMGCDTEMCKLFAASWRSRLQRPSIGNKLSSFAALPGSSSTWDSVLTTVRKFGESFEFRMMKCPSIRDIPHAAIDFHCSNMASLTARGALLALGVDEQCLRSLVWHNRSSVTNKTFLDGTKAKAWCGDTTLWKKVQPIVEEFTRSFLART